MQWFPDLAIFVIHPSFSCNMELQYIKISSSRTNILNYQKKLAGINEQCHVINIGQGIRQILQILLEFDHL